MSAKTKTAAKKTATKTATKTAAKSAKFKKGDVVKFTGWEGDAIEGAEDITEGMVGKVLSVSPDEVEVAMEIDGESVHVPFTLKEVAMATKADIVRAQAEAEEEEEESEEEEDDSEEEEEDDSEEEETEEEEDEETTVVDESKSKRKVEAKAPRAKSLGKLADGEDKTAIRELTKRCKAVDLDPDDYDSWVEVEKALKAAEKEAARPELKITAGVQEEIGEDGSDAITAAKRLVESAERTYYTLGGVLAYIDRNKTYETFKVKGEFPYQGREGFEAFCSEHIGVEYRKARYLIAIYEAFTNAGLTEKKIGGIGWSKAKELVAILQAEPDKVDQWVDKAKASGIPALKEAVKARMVKLGAKQHGNSGSKLFTCRFSVHQDEGAVVTEALALAKEQIETESDNEAFAHIMKEWISYQG